MRKTKTNFDGYVPGEQQLDDYPGCGHKDVDDMPITIALEKGREFKYRICEECHTAYFRPRDQDFDEIVLNNVHDEFDVEDIIESMVYNFSDSRYYNNMVVNTIMHLWSEKHYGRWQGHGFDIGVYENYFEITLEWTNFKQSFTAEFDFKDQELTISYRKHPDLDTEKIREWLKDGIFNR